MEAVRGKGRVFTKKHRQNISKALRGRRLSEETRKKIGDAVRRAHAHPLKRQFTAEHLAHLKQARRERAPHAWSTRLKISRKLKGRKLSEETKAKIRAARLGSGTKQKREVANKNLSESMKAVWVLRKARAEGGGAVPPWLQDAPEVQAAYDHLRTAAAKR